MNLIRRQNGVDLLVFALLVAIGVVGRWGQPEWCFTPIAAAAVFAGFYFSRLAIAALVPIAILTISDLVLPSYNNLPVMLLTYAAMTFPAWFGRMLRGEHRGWGLAGRWVLCGLAPATLFFVVSNSAVWAFQSDYEQSLSGLTQCFIAALPFYRAMLAGDVFYMTVLFACWALSGIRISAPRPVPERVRCESNQRD